MMPSCRGGVALLRRAEGSANDAQAANRMELDEVEGVSMISLCVLSGAFTRGGDVWDEQCSESSLSGICAAQLVATTL